jgi:hypothetical protein
MKLLTVIAFLLPSLLALGQDADDKPITLLSVFFAANGTDTKWIASQREIERQPPWNSLEEKPPLEPRDAWIAARKSIAFHFPRQELILDEITLKNVRFLYDGRDSSLQTVDRWFYVVRARPSTYRFGKPLDKEELWTAVVLMDGRVIEPRISHKLDSRTTRDKPAK